MKPADQWKLLEQWERARDGRLDEAEARALNEAILSDSEARRLLAEAALMDAELRLGGEPEPIAAPAREVRFTHGLTAIAAAIVAAGMVWMLLRDPEPVATLAKAHLCKWGNSELPTLEGGRLRPGMLELLEGIATLKFSSGAEVVLEAPVSLEVLSAMECRIKKGTVVAEVPPSAKGFTIHTPETKVVDFGTRFGVSAGEDGKCLVHVIEGLVEVERKGETEVKSLRAGQRVDYGGMTQKALNPDADDQREPDRWLPGPIQDLGDGWQMLTTAFGRGKDSWIQSGAKTQATGRESFLRVKHTTLDNKLERKAYVTFDLARFAGKKFNAAEFVLHAEPSDLGFASLVPDATFSIYGLTNEVQDSWGETELNWQDAPAHTTAPEHHSRPVPNEARLLGKVIVPQGSNRGAYTVSGADLVSFLNEDSNGLVTFIICRDTDETAKNGLAHAFASKENSRNTPPLLRLKAE
ncbi:MAG TPA: DNRLRE domain-containing protein [Prosthecobacter sp.]|nr:DNRLRE domain-containing protein [Prosthecobacter sp.]